MAKIGLKSLPIIFTEESNVARATTETPESFLNPGSNVTPTVSIVILGFGLLVCLVGNVLVATAVMSKSNRTRPEMWTLLNLCVANILYSAIVIPIQTSHRYLGLDLQLGQGTCKPVRYVVHVLVYVIYYMLGLHCVISFFVCYFRKSAFLQQIITRKTVLGALQGVWVLCALACIPTIIYSDTMETSFARVCQYNNGISSPLTNAILRLASLRLLPFLGIAMSTGAAIWRTTRGCGNRRQETNRKGAYRSRVANQERALAILLVILVLFVICCLPYDVTMILLRSGRFDPNVPNVELSKVVVSIATALEVFHVLEMLHPCILPLIYIALDRDIYTEIRCMCWSPRDTGTPQPSNLEETDAADTDSVDP